MEKYLLAILIFVSSVSFGQGYSNFGNTNPNDTARSVNNVLINRYLRLPQYAPPPNDTVFLTTRLANGMISSYSIKSLVNRISASIQPIDTTSLSNRINVNKQAIIDTAAQIRSSIIATTLQGAIDNGNDLDKSNTIVFGSNPQTWDGQRMNFVVDSIYSEGLIEYTDNRRNEYDERTLPDWGNVKDTVSEAVESLRTIVDMNEARMLDSVAVLRNLITISSFDTVLSAQVSSLTSPRFTRRVSTFNYGGVTFDRDDFTQNTTTGTLTFIGLIFYTGNRLTFNY